MPFNLSRRSLLATVGTLPLLSSSAFAQDPLLTVSSRVIEVNGKAARVFGIAGADGRSGLERREGDKLSGLLVNKSDESLVMHWHGQIHAPALQDRARPGGGELAPGEHDTPEFALTTGTHWMHSHLLNEQALLAAPLVTLEKESLDQQNVVVMLHDFSFRSPQEILAGLGGEGGAHMAQGSQMNQGRHGGHMGHGSAIPMAHANDIAYDAFLANDRTLGDPQVVAIDKGGKVRLRLINGATATAFVINTGLLNARAVAVDGSPCLSVEGRRFPLAQGQRLDLEVDIPSSGGTFPVFAQVENSLLRTGIILASAGSAVAKLDGEALGKAGFLDLSFDAKAKARQGLVSRPIQRQHRVVLGEAAGYRWLLNGKVHGEHTPLEARLGERVALTFVNDTGMMHPMHLHGHHFQVVGIDGKSLDGPMRDTVIVPPRQAVTVAFDCDKAGEWFVHCHHLYHMATGMMTELQVKT